MAIFYKHIKGCGASSTGQTGSTTDLWTWIKWADATDVTDNTTIKTATKDILPSIKINTTNTFDTDPSIDAGKIITSKASGQSIEQYFTLSAGVKIGFGSHFLQSTTKKGTTGYTLETNADLWISNTSLILAQNEEKNGSFNSYDQPFGQVFFAKTEGGVLDDQKTNVLKVISNTSSAKQGEKKGQILYQAWRHTFDGHVWAQKSLYVGGGTDKIENSSLEEGVIKVTQKCEALYFNATSDSRAKTNITPAKFSALSVVNNLPIYTFNYLSNPEKLTVGLIAQEAAQHNLDGFNMVDNLNATGLNNDMMQMKESKLVYVLWKAVQELSAEVEDLKTQLASLK